MIIKYEDLKAGLELYASYDEGNIGEDKLTVLGCITTLGYFPSIASAMGITGHNVNTFAELQPFDLRLLGSFEENGHVDYGDYYYMFERNLCRGSGAERLTFSTTPRIDKILPPTESNEQIPAGIKKQISDLDAMEAIMIKMQKVLNESIKDSETPT